MKKNGAHTNSCTTVQLDERNIHVGCCLFSHNIMENQTILNYEIMASVTHNGLQVWFFHNMRKSVG